MITANELRARTLSATAQLERQKIQLPPQDVLERQVLERMIVDRAQLQLARETGVRVDDATVNAAMGRIAEANNMTVPAMRQRLESEGVSFAQFREDIRQDILLNRLREREVDGRLQISESELDNFIADQSGVTADSEEINLAQILLRVPENATRTAAGGNAQARRRSHRAVERRRRLCPAGGELLERGRGTAGR